jgi:hypothetical protein
VALAQQAARNRRTDEAGSSGNQGLQGGVTMRLRLCIASMNPGHIRLVIHEHGGRLASIMDNHALLAQTQRRAPSPLVAPAPFLLAFAGSGTTSTLRRHTLWSDGCVLRDQGANMPASYVFLYVNT